MLYKVTLQSPRDTVLLKATVVGCLDCGTNR